MKIKKLTLIVAMLAMVLGIGSYAMAQVAEEPVVEQPVAEEPVVELPVAEEPVVEPPVAEQPVVEPPVVEEPVAEISCEAVFLAEQIELAEASVYPTSVSDQARECEGLGYVNYFPIPYFYDTEGFMYTLDPINDRYTSDTDPATGFYYIYDLVTDAFYTYDPVSGTYL